MKYILIVGIYFLSVFEILAQIPDKHSVRFKEGIYLNFEQVKNNNPIPKVQIRTTLDYSDISFFDELTQQEHIVFYDNLGNSKTVKTDQIWGYCNKGTLFINIHNQFNRIPVLGMISHFTAQYTYTEYRSPYSYSYYDRYTNTSQNKTELRQYLLDFKTGEVYEFHHKSVEALLSDDPELMEEYSSLSGRKKKKMKFFYIRKYNEKHPIKFNN
jgi:hypothetical protein